MSFADTLNRWLDRTPTPVVPSSWLYAPTLAAGGRQEVKGESFYQSALLHAAGGRTEDGTVVRRVTAVLKRQRWNLHDGNAVQVLVGGHPVGHIPRERTVPFHGPLAALGGAGVARARLTGGWDRGDGDVGTIGIELDLHWPPRVAGPGEPFLPTEKRVALLGESQCPAAATVPETFPVTLRVEDARILASVEAGTVGWLSPTMTPRYLPVLAMVREAGLPLTAWAFQSGGSITVGLPEAS